MTNKLWYLTAALWMVTGVAVSAEPAADAARRCSQVLGERERLACYDRAFPAGPQTSELATRSTPPAAPASATMPAPVPAAPVAASPAAAQSFGDDSMRRAPGPEEKAAKAAEPTTLTGQIAEIKEMRPNVWRLTLDNGQVWQQMDMSGSFLPKVGETLRIERGRFGGYSAALMGETRSAWVRVNRLK